MPAGFCSFLGSLRGQGPCGPLATGWPFPAHCVSTTHLSAVSLHASPEAEGKQPHAEEADGVPVIAQQPDSPALGKVFPVVAQGVGQLGGLALGADGTLLWAL